VHDVEIEWCGDGRPISIDQASVEPFPIVVHAGATITLAVTITVLEEIPVGSKIKLNIVKEGLIPFPIPCLDLNGTPIGSCEYEGDFLLEAATDALCGDELTPGGYFPPGQDCKLPLAPGVYGGKDPIVVTLPDSIPDLIVDLLANGKYHVDVTLKNADGSENTCVRVHLELGD